jgi:hypothetical protein
MNLPDSHIENIIPVLVGILRDVSYIDFDESLAWEGAVVCSFSARTTLTFEQNGHCLIS